MFLAVLLSLACISHSLIEVAKNADANLSEVIEDEYDVTEALDDVTQSQEDKFVIFTVASEDNDPFQRYLRSLRVFDMEKYLQVI